MKILIVEDDKTVAKTLKILLTSYNYAADIACDGDEGLQMADAYDYDLFLLDIMLPKLDGISLCKEFRAQGHQSPILLLTGQGASHTKAIALNAGADDYVVKPFDPEELIARVQALLRRSTVTHQTILSWGQLSIDPSTRKVAYGTHLVTVSPKEYGILELFLRKPQQALSASVILDHVWTSLEAPGEDVVRSHIKKLRRKLTALGAPKDFIKTLYKVGYQLNPLYASPPTPKGSEQPTLPQVAELNAVNEELRKTLEQLRSAQAELEQKHQELEVAYQTIAWERQQLKAAHDELEQRVKKRTAELLAANQTLQQQRDQWQALFEHALDAIAIADDNGHYLDVNPAACRLLGASRREILRSRVTHFAESEADIQQAWNTLQQQGQLSDELRLMRPDGTVRDVHVSAIANFVLGRHLLIMRDVSERKRHEVERQQAVLSLQESERKLSTLINNLPGYVYRVANDLSFTPEFVSEGVFEITGYHQADYLRYRTTSCGQEMHPDDRDWVWDRIQQAVESHQPYECEYRIVTRSGEEKWVWGRGQGVYADDGKLLYLEGFVMDITDRKQAEQALRESEQRLQMILDNSPAAIYVLDAQNRFLLANQMCAQLHRTPLPALLGKRLEDFWPPEDVDSLAAHNRMVLETGQRLQVEESVHDPDGRSRSYLAVKFPLWDAEGRPYAVCGISTDITDRKFLETQSYQAQRLESLGILASGIAHDLNNILTPVLAISKLLQLQLPNLEPQFQEMLQVLEDSAKRGAGMIKQILTFTRGTDDERSPIAIGSLLQEVLRLLQQTVPDTIALQATLPDPAPWLVAANTMHLHQVFMNLCVNACDAMPTGGTLSISLAPCRVDAALAQAHLDAAVGEYVVVTIADTGVGIPPTIQPRIFDPFFTTKAPGQGTGLGLAIVLGIIKGYGGFIQVFSEVGQGTQVKVYLPILRQPDCPNAPAPQTNPSPNPEAPPNEGPGESVLVIDDDLDVRTTTQTLLTHYHYRVLAVSDGSSAIDLYTQHQAAISLVILDITMPDMDGITLIQHLKAINPQVKIIAISGLPTQREPALAAGAMVFLAKPYTLDSLLAQVHTLLAEDG